MNTNRYPGWAGVCSFDPATEQVDVHSVAGDMVACPKCGGTGWMQWAVNVQGNCTECLGFGVIEHSPAPELVEVTGDTLPDEIAAILALTPHAADDVPWAEREALAAAVSEAGAVGLAESFSWCFAEKAINYEQNGDVLWK